MAIRLKDIAADLGVSIVTVSKVLRGKPDVGKNTRERVLRRVEELNYRPNMIARGLASGRSYTVGLVVPDIVDSFFAEFARSLGTALRGSSYQLLLASANENPEVEQTEIDNLIARGVDVVLVASCQEDAAGIKSLLTQSTPSILIDRSFAGLKANFIGTDDIHAGRLATEHLLGLGRRRIAHIGATGVSTAIARHEGYRQALKHAGVPYRKELVLLRSLQEGRNDQVGRDAMNQLLALSKPPDAVFCYSDLFAVGAIRAVRGHGLRVPEEIAVIGCGNLSLSSYLEVPLSSVDQGTAELGERAAKLALALIEGLGKKVPKTILVEPRVVGRASTLGSSSQ